MKVPDGADRDFTASGFVVEDARVLLVDHVGMGRWLQPGGHIEPRETPVEAAIREVREETGVVMRIHESFSPQDDTGSAERLAHPFRVNLHQVSADHWHVDFAYLGTVVRRTDPAPDEPDEARWFSRSDLSTIDRIDAHTRSMAVRAIETVSGSA